MNISRRQFVLTGAVAGAGALVIGVRFSESLLRAQESDPGAKKPAPNPFDAYVHVKPDGHITLIVAKSEMGQGIKTGLAMILAEEAEVDFKSVSVEQAETRPGYLRTHGNGRKRQHDGRISSAAARGCDRAPADDHSGRGAMECYSRLNVKRGREPCCTRNSDRKATYGELVEAARKLPLPDQEKVKLKDEADFSLIGHATPRVDIPSKVNGSAQFGIDVRVPGMVFAVVARCPTFGGKPAHFDAGKAKAVPGSARCF